MFLLWIKEYLARFEDTQRIFKKEDQKRNNLVLFANTTHYIRDGRAPVPAEEITSKIMSSIKAKNTKPEIILRKALNRIGIKGYVLHSRQLPGKPDISFPKKKVAIFVNGCYWHRCPKCNPSTPKTHIDFWKEKFKKNKARDKNKIKELIELGWKVLVVWECELKNIKPPLSRIEKLLK